MAITKKLRYIEPWNNGSLLEFGEPSIRLFVLSPTAQALLRQLRLRSFLSRIKFNLPVATLTQRVHVGQRKLNIWKMNFQWLRPRSDIAPTPTPTPTPTLTLTLRYWYEYSIHHFWVTFTMLARAVGRRVPCLVIKARVRPPDGTARAEIL